MSRNAPLSRPRDPASPRTGSRPVRRLSIRHRSALGLLALLVPAAALAGPAHQHGVAALDVVVDAQQVLIELHGPLDNLVGFEHAPRTAAQRLALATMSERLRDGMRLFVLPAAAQCRQQAVSIEHPHLDPPAAGGAGRPREGDGHAELTARWEFACAAQVMPRTLEVHLFEPFPRLQRVKARLVSTGGQQAATLNAKARTLRW